MSSQLKGGCLCKSVRGVLELRRWHFAYSLFPFLGTHCLIINIARLEITSHMAFELFVRLFMLSGKVRMT